MGQWTRFKRWLWHRPPAIYDPVAGTIAFSKERNGWLRAAIWRREGTQDPRTGEVIGTRDRILRRAALGLKKHWLEHWKFWLGFAATWITTGIAISKWLQKSC